MSDWPLSDAERKRRRTLELYREEMGREPPPVSDHPLAHQWEYRGTRDEREALRAEIEADLEPVPFIDGQESLL